MRTCCRCTDQRVPEGRIAKGIAHPKALEKARRKEPRQDARKLSHRNGTPEDPPACTHAPKPESKERSA